MNQKTLTKLEFDKIINLLAGEASSDTGKRRCLSLKPMTDLDEINTAEEQTAAAFSRILKKGRLSFSGCYSIEDSMMRLEVGGTLNSAELLRVCKLCEVANRAKSYGRHDTVDELADCLDPYFEQISPLTPLANEIRRCIIDEDEISSEASSNLKQIRRNISQINDKVHSTLNGLVNGSLRTYLQDAIITMRGDRYCPCESRVSQPGKRTHS